MDLDQKIGEKLRNLRTQNNYSTREVGRRIGVSNSYVSKIENGKIPSLTILQKLCDLYEIEMATLFGEKIDTPEKLKDEGVEWIALGEKMEKKNLTPDEVEEFVELVRKLRGQE